jgi:hypothetical protein
MLRRLKRVTKRPRSKALCLTDTHNTDTDNPLLDNLIGQTALDRQIKKEAKCAIKSAEIDEYSTRLRISLLELISNADAEKRRTTGIYAYSLNRSFKFQHHRIRKTKDRFCINLSVSQVLRELRSNKLIDNWYWEPCMHSSTCGYITIWL